MQTQATQAIVQISQQGNTLYFKVIQSSDPKRAEHLYSVRETQIGHLRDEDEHLEESGLLETIAFNSFYHRPSIDFKCTEALLELLEQLHLDNVAHPQKHDIPFAIELELTPDQMKWIESNYESRKCQFLSYRDGFLYLLKPATPPSTVRHFLHCLTPSGKLQYMHILNEDED